jgi:hypothetical protein
MPMSYAWLKKNRTIYKGTFQLARKGYRSYQTQTCGMHVHMSKHSFGTMQLWKFLTIIYKKENQKFVFAVSGRTKERMAHYSSLEPQEKIETLSAYKQSMGGRNTAVNLRNICTIELRLFKGTLSRFGFFRNIEFCVALHHYCGIASCKDTKYEDFVRWITHFKKTYPCLYRWCKRKYPSIVMPEETGKRYIKRRKPSTKTVKAKRTKRACA